MRPMAPSEHDSGRPGQPPDLRLVIDSTPALIHTARPDGYLDFFNETWLRYVGLPLEDLEGWKWTSAIHPEDVEGIVNKWRASLASGEPFLHEARTRRADGEYRWLLHHKVPLRDDGGNIVKWYGSSIDIEERKRAEDALKTSEAYLAEAQRLSHIGNFAYNPKSRKSFHWSEEVFRICGLDPQHGIPNPDESARLVHPDDRDRVSKSALQRFREKAEFSLDYRLLLHDGTVKHIHTTWHPVLDEAGEVVEYVGTLADVTEPKRAEEALRRSEAYLAEAQKLSHTGSFGWKVASGEIIWSQETFQIFEYDPKIKPTADLVLQRVHPEDAAVVKQTIERASQDGKDFEHEYRLVMPDGSLKYLRVVARAFSDESGGTEFVGAVMDVTAAKQAEGKVREQETELRQILDLVPQFVAVFGPGGERLYANRMGLDYLGLSLEEWRQTPGYVFPSPSFFHPDDRERAARTYSDNARSGGSAFELELRLRRHDGTYRWFLVRYNPLRDEQGLITRWYVALTDIEYRKQAEDRLRRENVALREEIDKASMFEEIVGASPALHKVHSRVSKVAPSDSTVLITGETGTGKELVARAIHKLSRRSAGPFVSVNCAAVPRELIASELFGHEKGSFTGALQRRLGRFELAEGGTIFLDEVGELPAETQITLLRVLQEREFERVGGSQPIRADVRVIAATNRDLDSAIAAGAFRSDLFYRLNVFPIAVPPLRERCEDIPILVEYFIARYTRKAGKRIQTVEKATMALLQAYSWPGNIRELQNVIERSVIVCESESFSVDPSWLSLEPTPTQPKLPPLAKRPTAQEKEIIEGALAKTGGRVSGPSGAATLLGMPASTLESKIRSLKINKFRYKSA